MSAPTSSTTGVNQVQTKMYLLVHLLCRSVGASLVAPSDVPSGAPSIASSSGLLTATSNTSFSSPFCAFLGAS